jgi:hypothetical protein
MDLFMKSVVNMRITAQNKSPDHIKKLGKLKYFTRTEILFVTTCILFSGQNYVILIACGLYNSVSSHTYLFKKKGEVKGKVHPITSHEGPHGE